MFTIKEAMEFGGLLGAEIVAGKGGMDRQIESVSVLEIAVTGVSQWMLKNQLYITSFYAIYDSVDKQKLVIKSLIESGCCGLVLCNVGVWVKEIDSEIIDLCDRESFPLIIGKPDISYIEIMQPIMNRLYHPVNQAEERNYSGEISDDVLQIVLNEVGTEAIFSKINKRLGLKVSYYNADGKLEFSDRDNSDRVSEKEYLDNNFNQVLYTCSDKGYMIHEINGRKYLIALISSRKTIFGVLVTDWTVKFSDERNNEIINSLIIAAALVMKKGKSVSQYRDDALEEYVTDLIVWNFQTDEVAYNKARDFNLDLVNRTRLIVVNLNTIQRTEPKAQRDLQDYAQKNIMPFIENYIKIPSQENWAIMRSDTILIFMNDLKIDIDEFSEKLLNQLIDKSGMSISIGISTSISSPKEFPRAYTEAFRAAILGRNHFNENQVKRYEDVYFIDTIKNMSSDKTSVEVSSRMLGPVLEYDSKHGTDLIKTMHVLIKCNNNIQNAADTLYVHKNTMLQRRNKIIEILGYSPFEMPHILMFTTALLILGL